MVACIAPFLKASHLDFVVASMSPWVVALASRAWSMCGGGFCNVKLELLRWDVARQQWHTATLRHRLGLYWGLYPLGTKPRFTIRSWSCSFAGCSSLATITGCCRLLQNRWCTVRGWSAMKSRSCWQLCFHARQRWLMPMYRFCAQPHRVGRLAPRKSLFLIGLTFLVHICFRLNWTAELLPFVSQKTWNLSVQSSISFSRYHNLLMGVPVDMQSKRLCYFTIKFRKRKTCLCMRIPQAKHQLMIDKLFE
jgi:hypothetical protein